MMFKKMELVYLVQCYGISVVSYDNATDLFPYTYGSKQAIRKLIKYFSGSDSVTI